jgi:hypothetical protein
MNLIKSIPQVEEGIDYERNDPRAPLFKYRFTLLKDVLIETNCVFVPANSKIEFKDEKGETWMTFHSTSIQIHKNYQWDGCFSKIYFFGLWLGMPDFKETVLGSLLYNAFLQFLDHTRFPFLKRSCDTIFKEILLLEEFKFPQLYYNVARTGTLLFS